MSNTVCQIRCNASIYDERRVPQTRLRNTVLLGLGVMVELKGSESEFTEQSDQVSLRIFALFLSLY